MRRIKIVLISHLALIPSVQVSKIVSSVWRWNSSGKADIKQSKRYY